MGCTETTIYFGKTEDQYFHPEQLTHFRLSEVICPSGRRYMLIPPVSPSLPVRLALTPAFAPRAASAATSHFDPTVWSGRAVQEVSSTWLMRSCITVSGL